MLDTVGRWIWRAMVWTSKKKREVAAKIAECDAEIKRIELEENGYL